MQHPLALGQILTASYTSCVLVCGGVLLISQPVVLHLRELVHLPAAVMLSLLVGLVLPGLLITTVIRSQQRALQQVQDPARASDPSLRRVRILLTQLAAEAGTPVPAVILAPAATLRSVGGAAVSFAPGQPLLLRVSRSLADGDERRLRAILAHELGHVADHHRCGRYAIIAAAAALTFGLPTYALAALARPELLELPSLAAVLLIYLPLSLLLSGSREMQADRFMLALDARYATSMLEHLAVAERTGLAGLASLHPRLRALRRFARNRAT